MEWLDANSSFLDSVVSSQVIENGDDWTQSESESNLGQGPSLILERKSKTSKAIKNVSSAETSDVPERIPVSDENKAKV